MAKVILTGINGQDASIMSKHLLSLGHEVIGITHSVARSHVDSRVDVRILASNPTLGARELIYSELPDYFINFGGISSPRESWENPKVTFEENLMRVGAYLEAIKTACSHCKFFSAGSCLEFGSESPYAISKKAAGDLVRAYRNKYDIFAIHCELFSHESPQRSERFVSRKITKGVAKIWKAIQDGKEFEPIILGNVNSTRDWSHAADIVWGIWLALQQNEARDYTFASGKTRTVKEFAKSAFAFAGLEVDENFCLNGKPAVLLSSDLYEKGSELDSFWGDSSQARNLLNWKPKISFERMVMEMVGNDIDLICQSK